MERIVYIGPDRFDRPIFRSIDSENNFFDRTCILVNARDSEEDILNQVSEKHITFFGNRFDCEPMGYPSGDIKIITREEAKKEGKSFRTYG